MKINSYLLPLLICVTTFTQNAQAQPTFFPHEELLTVDALHAPITFNPDGVHHFLRNIYNRREYSQDILPNFFSHFIEFLHHGKKTKQTRAYLKSVFKLFGNKIKAAPYVNAHAFSSMLEELPEVLGDYFRVTKFDSLEKYKEAINEILYSNFLSKYEKFRKDTHEFFDDLSQEIINTMQSDLSVLNENVSTTELRQAIIRFLEVTMGKLIWSPEEHKVIWASVKKISQQLEVLMDNNILDDTNDLDDLYWTLVHRFCYFLDITGPSLPTEFYEQVKNDIASQELLMLEIEEQEPLIESKTKCLMRALFDNQVKAVAAKRGIIVA